MVAAALCVDDICAGGWPANTILVAFSQTLCRMYDAILVHAMCCVLQYIELSREQCLDRYQCLQRSRPQGSSALFSQQLVRAEGFPPCVSVSEGGCERLSCQVPLHLGLCMAKSCNTLRT
eukprot:6474556-Amphidinium_carterae.1